MAHTPTPRTALRVTQSGVTQSRVTQSRVTQIGVTQSRVTHSAVLCAGWGGVGVAGVALKCFFPDGKLLQTDIHNG